MRAGPHPVGCRRPAAIALALLCGLALPAAATQAPGATQAPTQDPAQAAPQLVLGGQALDPEHPPEVLRVSLQDALALALQRNLDLAIEETTQEAARQRALGSWGSFDPVLALGGSVRDAETEAPSSLTGASVLKSNTQSGNGSLTLPFTTGGNLALSLDHENQKTNSQFSFEDVSTTDVVRLSFTQPLLRGAWKRYATSQQREAEIEWQKSRERQRTIRQTVLEEVHTAYWDLAASRELLDVRQLALDLAREELEQNRRRLDVGVGTEVDVLQAETTEAQREEQLIQARSDYQAAMDGLRQLFAGEGPAGSRLRYAPLWDVPIENTTALPEVPASTTPATSSPDAEWSQAFARALTGRSDLSEQRLEIEASEVRLSRAYSERLSELDLGASLTGTGFDGESSQAMEKAVGFDFPTAELTLSFSAPVGNRTARAAVREQRALVRLARLLYDQLEITALTEVRAGSRDLNTQAEAVAAARQSSRLARQQLAAEQARQDQGLSTTFQVLDFQRQLAEALQAESTARAAWAKALSRYLRAQGALSEDVAPWIAP